jgi:Winged helix-turn-helix domain (DUF2582)
MDVNSQVGETAGKVWHALSSAGPLTLAQLKKKVDGSGEFLSFGLEIRPGTGVSGPRVRVT